MYLPQKAQQRLIFCCLLTVLSLYLDQNWLAQHIYADNLPQGQAASNACIRPLNQWERHVIDEERPGRAAFLYFADIDNDGVDDVVTGGYWYRNPQRISGSWVRTAIGSGYDDTLAVHDFDGDGDFDLLGTAQPLNRIPFVWARNNGAGTFTVFNNIDSNLNPPKRAPIQGVAVARFQPDGPLEVAISWDDYFGGMQMLTVPADPTTGQWARRQASPFTQGEALTAADMDSDGDLDLFTGTAWLRNEWPADNWTPIVIYANSTGEPDRHRLVDMDHDGDLDAVLGYGHDPEAKVAWYEQVTAPTEPWTEHLAANLTTPAYGTPQSLDVADLDGDGDLDIVTAQHLTRGQGPEKYKLLQASVLENVDGAGLVWQRHEVYTGEEHHDGMQLLDVEGDGDLDIISIGWTHNRVILYENKGNTTCPTATTTPVATATATSTPTPATTAIVTSTATPTVTATLVATTTVLPSATPTLTLTPIGIVTTSVTPVGTPQGTGNAQLFLPLVTR